MRRTRFELCLATTAIALIAAGSSLQVQSAPLSEADISAAVPMPEPANLPPPSAADIGPLRAAPPATARPAQTVSPAAVSNPTQPAAAPAVAAPENGSRAVEPAAAPAEVPVLTIDQRVAEKLRDILAGKSDRIIDRKNKAAVEAFYAARSYMPIWVENGAESARAKAAATFLARVDADGLDPSDYPVPSFANADTGALAEAELKLTATVLMYARHAQIGRVHYSRVSSDIFYELVAPEPGAVLTNLADAKNIAEALDSYNPPQPGYKTLKAKLAEMRGRTSDTGHARISVGKTLKPGMEDPRVPLVRERLGIAGIDPNTTYDNVLAEAVKKFQRQRDLAPTGILNNATVDALNGPRRGGRDADIIIANMERWRWLPRDLGRVYVMVNIPDYTLKVVDRGSTVWTTKIVAGQPGEKATPMLSETMKYITINPTWNVPPSIINNEYLPALAQDPTVLSRMGLRLEYNRDGSVHIYQPPGEANALGRIRFNFPNKFLVYQHDTPDKHLFEKDKRAFSHGCMRVQFPDRYAELLLSIANPKDGYTVEKIHRMYGTGEQDIHLKTPIPVHLTYQTAFVDDAGHLAVRDDVYGRDSRLLAALKNEDRRIADMPIERREASTSTRRQAARMPMPFPTPNFFFGGLFR